MQIIIFFLDSQGASTGLICVFFLAAQESTILCSMEGGSWEKLSEADVPRAVAEPEVLHTD